jgi:hypothetical protein
MYLDTVVVAGLLIVILTIAFFGGVVYAIKKDMKKHPPKP